MQGAAGESKAMIEELHNPTVAPASRSAAALDPTLDPPRARSIDPSPDPPDLRTEPRKDELSPEQVTQAAHEVRAAAAEIRLLLGDLRRPATMPALEQAVQQADSLVWRITRNVAELIVLAFAFAVAWLLVAWKLRRTKTV